MLKIIDGKDIELRNLAEEQLKENKDNYGKRYCPCSFEHNKDTICPCKAFREQDYVGECNCGRYEKVK